MIPEVIYTLRDLKVVAIGSLHLRSIQLDWHVGVSFHLLLLNSKDVVMLSTRFRRFAKPVMHLREASIS